MNDLPEWAQDRLDADQAMGKFEAESRGWKHAKAVGLAVAAVVAVLICAVIDVIYTFGTWGAALEWWSR